MGKALVDHAGGSRPVIHLYNKIESPGGPSPDGPSLGGPHLMIHLYNTIKNQSKTTGRYDLQDFKF